MKLVHSDFEMQIIFEQGIVPVLILESSKLMKEYVEDMLSQLQGKNGKFTLSVDGRIIRIDKEVELIINPFAIDINNRKLIKGIYDKMSSIAVEENHYISTQNTLKAIIAYFMDLFMAIDVDLEVSTKVDYSSLFKSFGIEVPISGNLVEDLLVYLDLTREYQGVKLTVFANLSTFLDYEEMDILIREIAYNEHKVLLLERFSFQEEGGAIKRYIVDEDYCEIF